MTAIQVQLGLNTMEIAIDTLKPDDWAAVRRIYLDGLATGNASFETESPLWETWDAKHHRHSRLVARSRGRRSGVGGAVAGFAACLLFGRRGSEPVRIRRLPGPAALGKNFWKPSSRRRNVTASGRYKAARFRRTSRASGYKSLAAFESSVAANEWGSSMGCGVIRC